MCGMLLPERLAALLLRRYWDGRLPVNVKSIVERIPNVSVEYAPLDGRSGEARYEGGRYVLRVNSRNESRRRQRFTLAHELGHVILGHVTPKKPVYREPPSNEPPRSASRQERDANLFAAATLMPSDAVLTAIHEGLHLNELTDLFDVSKKAMLVRLVRLGILPPWTLDE